MSEKLKRKAKSKGDFERQLSSYVDNLSSSGSSDYQNTVLSQTDDDLDSLPSSISPPVPPPLTNTNETELQSMNDEGSLSSSISPPPAPAPPPLIMTEEELTIENHEIENMVDQKQEIEQILKEKKEEFEKILKEKEKQIDNYFIKIGRKTCFLSLEINGKFSDDILIKLYYEKAPVTSNYFRSICIGQRGFGFEDTFFNCLYINGFIEGGERQIYTRNGNRFFDQVPKEKDQRLPHNKAGLLSMSLVDRTTKFIITLGPMPDLNDTHVVFGEVTSGMNILNAINQKGIRNISRGNAVNLGEQLAATGAIQNDIFVGCSSDGADADDNKTQARDDLDHSQFYGMPMDKVVIYACGEKD